MFYRASARRAIPTRPTYFGSVYSLSFTGERSSLTRTADSVGLETSPIRQRD